MKAHTIVVGYDGSADARRALDVAIDHVADDGIVHVLTAFDRHDRDAFDRLAETLPAEFQHLDAEETPRGYLRVAERTLASHDIPHVGHFVVENPAAAILDLAEEVDADLIVIGTRGLGRIERFVRGSVSARVANNARTSLMMVHHEPESN